MVLKNIRSHLKNIAMFLGSKKVLQLVVFLNYNDGNGLTECLLGLKGFYSRPNENMDAFLFAPFHGLIVINFGL